MRILLISDLHANWPALQAVATEPHDLCVCLGDLVDYGLEPTPCIAWVRDHARHAVRGNHDHGVAQNVNVIGRNGFKFLTSVTRPLTQERLSGEDRRYLSSLPVTRARPGRPSTHRAVPIAPTRKTAIHASSSFSARAAPAS